MGKARLDVDVNVDGEEQLEHTAGLLDQLAGGTDDTSGSLQKLSSNLNSLGSGLTSAGAALTAGLTVPIVGIGAAALTLGANAIETENLVRESFQGMTSDALQWSEALSDSLGLNKFALQEQAASFQLLAENMGQPREAAFETATSLTELAADLDSFLNLSQRGIDPIQALQSGLVGNSEALRSLNIFVNDATLRQIAFETGITETNRQLTQQEKFMATLEAITRQTAAAQGDLARTLDSPINQMRAFRNRIVEATTELGQALLPVFERLLPVVDTFVSGIEKAVEIFSNLPGPVQTTIVAMAGLAAAIGPILIAAGTLVTLAGSVVGALGTLAASGLSVAGVLGGLAATVGTVLASALAAAAVAVAAFKLTDLILEATGLRDVLVDLAGVFFEVTDAANPMRDATAEQKQAFDDFVASQNEAIGTSRTYAQVQAEAATATGASAEELKEIEKQQKAAAAAAEAHAKSISSLADSIGVTGIINDASALNQALAELAERGERLSDAGINRVIESIKRLKDEGLELPPLFEQMDQKFKQFAANALANLPPIVPPTIDWAIALNDVGGEFDELGSKMPPLIDEGVEGVGNINTQTINWGDAMTTANDILSETRGLMNLLGVESDSTFGKIIAGVTKAFDTFNSVLGIIDRITGAFGQLSGAVGGGGGGGLFGAIGGLFGGGGDGGGGGLGGLLGGLGGLIPGGGLALALAPAIIGGLAGLGGLIGDAFSGLFGGRDAQTVAAEAGRDLGVTISESLAESIHESGQNVQLALAQIFQEAGAGGFGAEGSTFGLAGINRFAEELGDVFSGIEQGLFSTQEGMNSIGQSIPFLLDNFNQLGEGGTAQVERLLRASFETGASFQGQGDVVRALGEQLVASAQMGGDAWLNATNAIGTTGRESLDFLRNAFGQELPGDLLNSINELLGLSSALGDQVAPSGENAAATVAGLADAASQAGQGGVFGGLIGDLGRVIEEARAAGSAMRSVGGAGGGIGGREFDISAQGGFFSPELMRDTTIRAHRGEAVRIGEPQEVLGATGGGNVTMGNIMVSGAGKSTAEILDEVERNQGDQLERLRRILKG